LSEERYTQDRSLDYYLKEIGEVELLDQKEEMELARRIRENNDPEALEKLTKANLRFVVNVAKKYQNRGLSLLDMINEGNLGLIKAAKRFNETLGYKFISYAVWWIRQAILQAIAEQSRAVRLPLNRVGDLYKIGKLNNDLTQEFGREPSITELAEALGMEEAEVAETLKLSRNHLSLDAPLKEGENNRLIDFIEDDLQPSPDSEILNESLVCEIRRVLRTLTPRESEILCLYFGIGEERSYTLEEIGQKFNLTRERIRQIKEKAIRKLRHASRSRRLKAYLN